MLGTVTHVFVDRGYGFVRGKDGVSRFFHVTGMSAPQNRRQIAFDTLAVGTIVRFEHADHDRGPRATSVEPIYGTRDQLERLADRLNK